MDLAKGFRLGGWLVYPERCCMEPLEADGGGELTPHPASSGPQRMEPKLMALLQFLAERAGEVVTHEAILEQVWPDAHVARTGLTRNMSQLRKLLGDNRKEPQYIETISKVGYRLLIPVEPLTGGSQDGHQPVRAFTREPRPRLRLPLRWFPLALSLLVVGFLLGWSWFQFGSEPKKTVAENTPDPSFALAVLPFVNRGGNPDEEYLADGFTEDLITELSRENELQVVARTSCFAFKGKALDIRDIAAVLNVNRVVEGSLQRDGQEIRVVARLVDASNGFQLWSQTYERDLDHLLSLQLEISRTITAVLAGTVVEGEPDFVPVDVKAYDYYLLGQYWCHKGSVLDFPKAIEMFQSAVAEDPAFARAWSAMGRTWVLLAITGSSPSEPCLKKAEHAARQALAFDPAQDEAIATLGMIAFYRDLDWRTAEEKLRQAIALHPQNPLNHLWYAQLLTALGRGDEAAVEIASFLRLDPLNSLILVAAAEFYLRLGQFDEAEAVIERALSAQADFLPALFQRAKLAEARGRWSDALETYSAIDPQAQWFPYEQARILVAMGEVARARELLAQDHPGQTAFHRSLVHLALGEADLAMDFLERSWSGREPVLLEALVASQWLDPVRNHPRFLAIAEASLLPVRTGATTSPGED